MWLLIVVGVLGLVVGTLFGWVTAAGDEDISAQRYAGVPDRNAQEPLRRRKARLYGSSGYGRSYGPGEMHHFNPGGSMKACHACGQKLPLKVGDVVESRRLTDNLQGVVIRVIGGGAFANIQPFDGTPEFQQHRTKITRLHGYYRITERETL